MTGFSSCQLSPDMKLVVVNEASSNVHHTSVCVLLLMCAVCPGGGRASAEYPD